MSQNLGPVAPVPSGEGSCSSPAGQPIPLTQSRHRPGRHKKFRVRREALGVGYERYYPLAAKAMEERQGELPAAVSAPEHGHQCPSCGQAGCSAPSADPGVHAACNAIIFFLLGVTCLTLFVLSVIYTSWLLSTMPPRLPPPIHR